jgi:hypothetical protein
MRIAQVGSCGHLRTRQFCAKMLFDVGDGFLDSLILHVKAAGLEQPGIGLSENGETSAVARLSKYKGARGAGRSVSRMSNEHN